MLVVFVVFKNQEAFMKEFEPIPEETEQIATAILDCAFKIHRFLGPGLLESVYEICLAYELEKQGIPFQRQIYLPVIYEGVRLETGLRLDLLVADKVIVELKAVEKMNPLYEAQLMTYLRLTGLRLGLLLNFNVAYFKDGIKRIVI